jgi:hypothetical protein
MRSIKSQELPTVLHAVVSKYDTRIMQSEAAAKGIITAHNNRCEYYEITDDPMKRYKAVIEAWEEM